MSKELPKFIEEWPLKNKLFFYALLLLNPKFWPGLVSGKALESKSVQTALEDAYKKADH